MNKRIFFLLIIAIITLSAFGGYYFLSGNDSGYTLSRSIRYSLTLQNITHTPVTDASVWVFGPVKQTSWQLTTKISADTDFTLDVDNAGNQILRFGIHELPPFATKVIRIKAELLLAERPQKSAILQDDPVYLAEAPFIETSRAELISLANSLAVKRPERMSRNIFDWVSSNIEYSGFIKSDRGALYAYQHRKGDCTEFMYLYTALCRINGLATRGIGGYIIREDSVLKARDYHNWAESYIDNRWRVIDPQNKVHLQNENHYIAFRVFHRNNNQFIGNTHRFSHSDHGIKITMD